MTELYLKDEPYILEKKVRKIIVLCVAILLVAIGVSVGLCFMANKGNVAMLETVAIVLCAIAGFVDIFLISNVIVPCVCEGRFALRVSNASRRSLTGSLCFPNQKKTFVKDMETEVAILTNQDGEKTSLIWNCSKTKPSNLESNYRVEIVGEHIVAFEEVK